MYTFVTRNVDANKLEAGNIQPITHVKIENDPEKQIKGEKLFLYNGDKCLGCLAVEESSLLPGTKSAKELTEEDIVGHALMSRRRCSKDYTFCKMELFLAKDILEKAEDTAADQKNNNQIVLLFGGTRTTCPGKGELLKSNATSCVTAEILWHRMHMAVFVGSFIWVRHSRICLQNGSVQKQQRGQSGMKAAGRNCSRHHHPKRKMKYTRW